MKVVIIGGVAGGASTAARLRRLDESAEIVVIERDHYVSYANCGLPYHLGGVIADRNKLLVQTPEQLRQSLNLDVRVGHQVIALDRLAKQVQVEDLDRGTTYGETYDKLVLALGASPIRPNLPGIDHPNLYVLRNIPDMDGIMARLSDHPCQAATDDGGGYIGLEVAENLIHRGLQVDLVERLDQVMAGLDPEMARDLQYHLMDRGVALHLGVAAESFTDQDGRISAHLSDGKTLTADLLIMAVGDGLFHRSGRLSLCRPC
jgi:NADPH-dependent 2,4-dienoyl-CoA reductase/sulfur reductase-like enzyme